MVGVDPTGRAVAVPSLHGDDPAPWLGEGAPSGESIVPAPATPAARIALILEAVVGVLQGVSVAGPGLVGLQAGAQALQAGERPLINTAVNEAWRHCLMLQMPPWFICSVLKQSPSVAFS